MKIDKLRLSSTDFTDAGGGNRDTSTNIEPDGKEIVTLQTFTGAFFKALYIKCIIRYGYLNIEYSPATYAADGKHNLTQVSFEDVKTQVKEIEVELLREGIAADLHSFNVLRMDFALDRAMDGSFKDYKQVLKGLRFRSGQSKEYGSSFYQSNGQSTLTFYDKLSQLKKHSREVPTEYYGKNIIRCELRFLTKQKIISICGSAKLADVLSSQSKIEASFLKTLRRGMYC